MSSAIPSGPVIIRNVASGRVLDADTGTLNQDGTRVQLWSANGQQNQHWSIVTPPGVDDVGVTAFITVLIVNAESGRYLDADTGTINNDGTKVQLYGFEGSEENRQWEFLDQGGGTFVIKNGQSGRVLDADTLTLNQDGTRVQLWSANGQQNQHWTVASAPFTM